MSKNIVNTVDLLDSDVAKLAATWDSTSTLVKRVDLVAKALRRNKVGTTGAPSQNTVLGALAEAIAPLVPAYAIGYAKGNLGHYARVSGVLSSLVIEPTHDRIAALYTVLTKAAKALPPIVAQAKDTTAGTARETFFDAALATAIEDYKAGQRAKAEAKAGDEGTTVEGDSDETGDVTPADVAAPRMAPAAFIRSVLDYLDGASDEELAEVAAGLENVVAGIRRELADA